jgi:hypothetical protein
MPVERRQRMSLADTAPAANYGQAAWAVLCAGLACLFLVSTVVLLIVLMRRNRRGG